MELSKSLNVVDIYLARGNRLTIILCCSVSGGTTWHAAGLINPLRGGINDVKLSQYAIDLFPKLEQETDASTGMRNTA